MKGAVAVLLLCLVAGAEAGAVATAQSARNDHPIAKVINLLQTLKGQVETEAKAEEVSYSKYTYWCQTSVSKLKAAIEEGKAAIEELEDTIEAKTQEEAALTSQIETLGNQLVKLGNSKTEAGNLRSEQEGVYTTSKGDLEATIKAIGDAIKEMKGAQSSTAPALLHAQRTVRKVLALVSVSVSDEQVKALEEAAGLEQRPSMRPSVPPPESLKAYGDYAAHVDKYNFKSNNVIELLKGLQTMFEDKLVATEKAETNALNAHELTIQALDNEIAAATKAKGLKETELGEVTRVLGQAKGDLVSEQADLKADEGSLATTEEACEKKKQEWEERSETRKNEIEAMVSAIEVLSKVTGVRSEAPTNPIPPAPVVEETPDRRPADVPPLLLQSVDPKSKVINLLRDAAKTSNSKTFERFVAEITAHLSAPGGAGPFDEVINMVQKMIFRLMDEQKNEDEHKHWCDLEIEKTESMRDDKVLKLTELKASYDAEKAAVGKLTTQITDAHTMVSDITDFMAEATEIRNAGKKENEAALKDSRDAQKALAEAVAVLRDFYKDSGMIPKKPWEFIQQPTTLEATPTTWGSPYVGVADPKDPEEGIIAMLETVANDFAKMEAETSSQEAADQEVYEQQMKAHAIEKSRYEKEAEMKEGEKKRRSEEMQSIASEMNLVEGELEQTKQYLKDLEPACINGTSTYEDRKEARSNEIEALQQAQTILANAFTASAPSPAPARFLEVRKHEQ